MSIDDLDSLKGKPSTPCNNLGKISYSSVDAPNPLPLGIPVWMSDLLEKVSTHNGIPRDELLRCWIIDGLTRELRSQNRDSRERYGIRAF